MNVICKTVGPFEMNCYIVYSNSTRECILIDPADELEGISETISEHKLKPVAIFNTHNHVDHLRHVSEIQDEYDLPFYISEKDLPLVNSLKDQGQLFGLEVSEPPKVTKFVEDGEQIDLIGEKFRILHTPGHSPGSICLLFKGHVFVGDVLFQGSIGRTDLFGGNYNQLLESIKTKLLTLPDETEVYPGHGPQTTIGRERKFNPFLNSGNFL
jgi:glyoxylase-like metal-dependent hydrolase (beta-lactamase superfamily II)